jgi:hypothetical protein
MSKRKQRGLKSTNTSGYRGVIQRGNRFRAEITINRQRQYVGTFDTAKEARAGTNGPMIVVQKRTKVFDHV